MSYTVSMNKAGRIVIPKKIREQFGADESTTFELDVIFDRIELVPKENPGKSEPKVFQDGGMWVVSTEGETFDAAASIRAIREERLDAATPEEKTER